MWFRLLWLHSTQRILPAFHTKQTSRCAELIVRFREGSGAVWVLAWNGISSHSVTRGTGQAQRRTHSGSKAAFVPTAAGKHLEPGGDALCMPTCWHFSHEGEKSTCCSGSVRLRHASHGSHLNRSSWLPWVTLRFIWETAGRVMESNSESHPEHSDVRDSTDLFLRTSIFLNFLHDLVPGILSWTRHFTRFLVRLGTLVRIKCLLKEMMMNLHLYCGGTVDTSHTFMDFNTQHNALLPLMGHFWSLRSSVSGIKPVNVS